MRSPWLLPIVVGALTACGDSTEPSPSPGDAGPADANLAVDAGETPDASDGRFTVFFRVTVPQDTPVVPEVHIVGDFQGWDPASPDHRMTRVRPDRWEIELRLAPGPIAYKYARGAWDRVEKGVDGVEVDDRTLEISADVLVEDTVVEWADRPAPRSTITGDVRRLELLDREVLVYLPPGYDDDPTRRYPVLYMFDGQNVFDARTSFAGEWEADEAAERLIDEGEIEPLIIVGIENGGRQRLEEYTPWRDPDFREPGGGGQAHLQSIVDEVLPTIDAMFRTRTDAADTGIGGSSLGGLMAAYAGLAFANEFGRIASVSPSIWWDDQRLVDFVSTSTKPAGAVFYADMGTLESGGIPALRVLRDALAGIGFLLDQDLFVEEIEGGQHNESAWRARFPDILRRLFPPP